MKKIISVAVMAIFILSLVPLAFADEISIQGDAVVRTSAETSVKSDNDLSAGAGARAEAKEMLKAKAEERKEAYKQRLEALKEAQKMKIKALSAERQERFANLSSERLEKIAELDAKQIEKLSELNIRNVEKIAELKKERLEKLAGLREDKLERLSGLEKDKLEKIADLSKEELEKLSSLSEALLRNLTKHDVARLKARLSAIAIVKVKNADDLDRREISALKLSQIKDRFEKAREKFNDAKEKLEDEREKLKGAKEKRDEKAALEHAKNYLLRVSDALASHLEKLKSKVQENANIDDEREAKIVAEIDSQISAVASIKAEIEASATKEQLKEATKKLREIWSGLKHVISLHSERVISARVEGIVNKGLVLEKKLNHILEEAKEKGIEIDVSADISAFSEKIASAKDKHSQAQAKLDAAIELKAGNATKEEIKAAADSAKMLLKEARESLKDAHDILKGIVKKIKAAMPEADLSEDVEVEVEQEAAA
ncbi:hypothetical protein HYS31_01640 [Candidatus Woesearchaeota archaeon]|nr:hypothetical protein [Candidatus Woesearchaeota archaeon]